VLNMHTTTKRLQQMEALKLRLLYSYSGYAARIKSSLRKFYRETFNNSSLGAESRKLKADIKEIICMAETLMALGLDR
jgi:hypothetical protein